MKYTSIFLSDFTSHTVWSPEYCLFWTDGIRTSHNAPKQIKWKKNVLKQIEFTKAFCCAMQTEKKIHPTLFALLCTGGGEEEKKLFLFNCYLNAMNLMLCATILRERGKRERAKKRIRHVAACSPRTSLCVQLNWAEFKWNVDPKRRPKISTFSWWEVRFYRTFQVGFFPSTCAPWSCCRVYFADFYRLQHSHIWAGNVRGTYNVYMCVLWCVCAAVNAISSQPICSGIYLHAFIFISVSVCNLCTFLRNEIDLSSMSLL